MRENKKLKVMKKRDRS